MFNPFEVIWGCLGNSGFAPRNFLPKLYPNHRENTWTGLKYLAYIICYFISFCLLFSNFSNCIFAQNPMAFKRSAVRSRLSPPKKGLILQPLFSKGEREPIQIQPFGAAGITVAFAAIIYKKTFYIPKNTWRSGNLTHKKFSYMIYNRYCVTWGNWRFAAGFVRRAPTNELPGKTIVDILKMYVL